MRRIWIDTDLALGAEKGDVDDGFAIAAVLGAARRGEVELLGISAVSGNTSGAIAHRATQDLVRAFRVQTRVVNEVEAPAAIAALPEGASLLAIGPPSNLTKAAAIDPALPERIEARMVGTVTSRLRHPILALFDLNFRFDRSSTRTFWSLKLKQRTIFPLDVVRALRFGESELLQIAKKNDRGAYLAKGAERWLAISRRRYGEARFPVWDLVAALGAIDRLPGARYNHGSLITFDAKGAFAIFLDML